MDMHITSWSGPQCPSCGTKIWINVSSKEGTIEMICAACKKSFGPEIKHSHKKLSPENFYESVTVR